MTGEDRHYLIVAKHIFATMNMGAAIEQTAGCGVSYAVRNESM
jgi:hypothetical protein